MVPGRKRHHLTWIKSRSSRAPRMADMQGRILRHDFLGGLAAIIAVLPHIWERLHDYQQERILTFIDPERDPSGSG